MTDSANPQVSQEIWVGLWHGKRHVVFDPSIQPENSEFMLLYFVEGHSLCARKRVAERNIVTTVRNPYDREFALEQYGRWCSTNASIAAKKKVHQEFEVENPPPYRKKCPQCDGQPNWIDTAKKPTYGVMSEGPNIVEHCQSCNGLGFVNDVL